MLTRLLISFGAGLAAAVFFIIPVKGAMSAGLTMLFSPLPLMIAGLAFSPSSVLAGTLAGALMIFAFIHEYYALFFIAWAGVPAWWLTRLAWLARPAENGADNDEESKLVWYPVGGIAFWAALCGAGVAAAMVLVGSAYMGGYEAFRAEITKSMTALLEEAFKTPSAPKLPDGANPAELARYVAMAMPPVIAGWAALSYALNMWLAGRVTLVSQRLQRPWTATPEALRMPKAAALAMAASIAATAIDGLPRALGLICFSGLFSVYALQGLAVIHALTRPLTSRIGLLTAVYLSMFLFFPAPFVMVAVFALAHALLFRNAGQSSSPNPIA